MNYQAIISKIYNKLVSIEDKGNPAAYIPELAKVDIDNFGIYLSNINGSGAGEGDFDKPFSIQSISKVFSLCIAYGLLGEKMWSRVGVEPSGTAFNSLLQLENDNGIPRNPFLNSGAMVVCDILISHYENPKKDMLNAIREMTENYNLEYSPHIVESEKSAGFRNIALCNYIKSYGNIHNEPEVVLDLYFNLCSITLSCKALSKAFLFLANNGTTLSSKHQILSNSQCKRINAIMQTCGFYDESGEFTFKVGLPGKSGVGGGIIAVHPNNYTIAVWSPKLNLKGNSFKGMKFLEEFTTETKFSIF